MQHPQSYDGGPPYPAPQDMMHPRQYDTPMQSYIVSPEMNPHMHLISPGPHAHHLPPPPPMGNPHHEMMYQPMPHHQPHQGVPPHPNYYMPIQRHPSVQPARPDSPHMMGADVFGSMSRPGSTSEASMALDSNGSQHMSQYDYMSESYSDLPQGISPARALGPAPQVQPFMTPGSSDSHTTPSNRANMYNKAPSMSSSSAGSSTDLSSSVDRPVRGEKMPDTSDDENDSPTKRVRDRIPTFDSAESSRSGLTKKPLALTVRRPSQPAVKAPAGRTSAKFAKVAEDPGVEGVPPGPRSSERPSQSFACIIGQAILKSSAGGLSLEHIYRYVETAYPYFKTVEQWRNSVRHNLSIHKIFVTIPRTDRHPPGKGGIWVIDEAEKIHWPSEDKFIKNFPPSHPHHGVCRQTLHERAQEKKLRDKAEAEGRPYVPKNRKRSKALAKADDMKESSPMVHAGPGPSTMLHSQPIPLSQHMPPPPLPSSPPPPATADSSFDFEDDSDFIPADADKEPVRPRQFSERPRRELGPPPLPPRFTPTGQENKRVRDDDDENVFGSGQKRVRMSQPEPLSPILEQQPTNAAFDPDLFITPSRERSAKPPVTDSSRLTSSSMMRTPALVQTSSSPTSSPMPPTVTRSSHHPSSLQQAWTHDDMIANPSSPAKLEAAFDLKPTPKRERDDDLHLLHSHHERGPPKTPVTRSSAAADRDRTPRVGGNALRTPGMVTKTPLTYGSPARAPPSASALLSTPMWEMNSILDRMNANESPTRTPRSDVPPTSPTHYSLSDCGDSPIAKRRKLLT